MILINYANILVIKMLAVMEATSQAPSTSKNSVNNTAATPESANAEQFLASGRTGRRNALPDILGKHIQLFCTKIHSPVTLYIVQSLYTTKKKLTAERGVSTGY